MKLNAIIAAAGLGLAAAVSGTMASAATVGACATDSGLACLVTKGQFGSGNGNDKEDSVELALAAALNLSSIDLELLGKSDEGYGSEVSGKSGTWSTTDAVSFFTVKAANSYIIYDGNGATSGSWSTMGIFNNNNQQQELSHISYWSAPEISAVPLPAAGFLLIGALGGLAAMRRLKTA